MPADNHWEDALYNDEMSLSDLNAYLDPSTSFHYEMALLQCHLADQAKRNFELQLLEEAEQSRTARREKKREAKKRKLDWTIWRLGMSSSPFPPVENVDFEARDLKARKDRQAQLVDRLAAQAEQSNTGL